jgi:hypothetical protein
MPKPIRLVLLSALMLFVELALIRWTGSNVVFLSYFSNFVLLGSFLGIGIGFLRGKARRNLFPYAPVALTVLVGLVLMFPVQIDRQGSDLIFFGGFNMTGLPVWITLPVIFVLVATVLALIAEGVARTFVEFEGSADRVGCGGRDPVRHPAAPGAAAPAGGTGRPSAHPGPGITGACVELVSLLQGAGGAPRRPAGHHRHPRQRNSVPDRSLGGGPPRARSAHRSSRWTTF